MFDSLLLFSLSFFGGFLGVASGGGGAIFGFLGFMFLGYPIHVAIGTGKLGALGRFVLTLHPFFKAGLINKQLILKLCAVSIVGTFIGSSIAVLVSEEVLRWIIIIFLSVTTFLYWYNTEFGLTKRPGKKFGTFYYFLGELYGGVFTAGSGIIKTIGLIHGKGMTALEALGNKRIPAMVGSVVSVVVFLQAGFVDFQMAIPVFWGTLFGGYFGARTAILKGSKFVKYMGIFALLITIVYLLLR